MRCQIVTAELVLELLVELELVDTVELLPIPYISVYHVLMVVKSEHVI